MCKLKKLIVFIKEIIKKRSDLLILIILPFILVVITEFVHRGSFVSAIKWVQENRNEFLVSYLIATCLIMFIASLTKRINQAFFMILSVSVVFSLISSVKFKFRGEPLLPWDIILGKEAGNIAFNFSEIINLKIIFFMLAYFSLGYIFIYKLPEQIYDFKRKSLEKRVILCFLSLALLLPIYSDKPIPIKQNLGIQSITWDQGQNYSTNGLFLSFLLNLQWLSVNQPYEYSEESINTILLKSKTDRELESEHNPNIIMVMSEAFWDPTVMKDVSFSSDPLPCFHSLQKKHTSGRLLVSIFGGGTVNTEFEALTGNTMQFLPGGAVAYAQYVRKPIESLAGILATKGYNPIAIHTYHNWFYRRNEVYKNLGFNKYISSEFFINPSKKGDYIEDSELSKMIIAETEKSEQPVFIFAVSMQNHGPYPLGKSGKNKIKVSGNLSNQAKDSLETYVQGLSDADRSLKMLVEHFEKKSEPTMIVFFGDHLPLLGENYQVYREAGFYKEDHSYSDYRKMYSVPLLIWSNYPLKKEKIDFNASFLSPYVLNLANKQGSEYTNFLSDLMKSTPLIPKETYYEDLFIDQNRLEDYKLLQHDILFGNGYIYEDNEYRIVDEQYFLGREKIILNSVKPKEITAGENFNLWNNESSLELFGDNFVPDCQIYLNGKPQPTAFGNESYLTTIVPAAYYNKPGELEVQVKLTDTMGKIIAESNLLTINILE